MVQVLTVKKVKEAGLKAYNAKTLTAQHPTPSKRLCMYEIDAGAFHCVIGAAFNKTTLTRIMSAGSEVTLSTYLKELINKHIVRVAGGDKAYVALRNLQMSHDAWAHAAFLEQSQWTIEEKELAFLRLLVK